MTLPASGQLDVNAIYNEYYKTNAPANTDLAELYPLYQGTSTSNIGINHFHGFEAIQARMYRFQDPYSSAWHLTDDACVNSDNNMRSGVKYNFTILAEPSFGGYSGGTIDVSIRVDCSIFFSTSGNPYSQNLYVRCSSNGGTTWPITVASSTYTGSVNRDVNMTGQANISNVSNPGSNLKFQIQQTITEPAPLQNWNSIISKFNLEILAVHNDQALKTTRIGIGSLGVSGTNFIQCLYVSGIYDYINWDMKLF
jgi:hypothetical protein